jgi:hypothetical protein
VRLAAAVICLLAAPRVTSAQVTAQERDALVRLAEAAGAKGLPVAPLMNKIREGIAKKHDAKQIELVVSQRIVHLETADRIVRDVEPAAAGASRDSVMTLLLDALESGLTAEEIRALQQQVQPSAAQDLAGAAKGLAFIKDAGLPLNDGTAVMAEAVRQRYRPFDMQDLGREVKRREADYRSGRASLRALRDAIARGTRPDVLLRDSRAVVVERPAAARPATDRPERTTPLDRPQRPERPVDRPPAPGGERTR